MINPSFMQSYEQNLQSYSPPKSGQKKQFHEKFHTDKMFGQPLNRIDSEQAKQQMKTKNYGDIEKINQIYKSAYNMKGAPTQTGNSYQGLYFSKQSYLKNRESSLDASMDSQQRRSGKKIVNGSSSNIQMSNKDIHQYYQSQQQQNIQNGFHQQNSYREFHQQQNSFQPSTQQQQAQYSSNQYDTPQRTISNKHLSNNENMVPHTSVSDFKRQPTKDEQKQYQFSPQKRPVFVPDKVSCKKRFEEHSHNDTTITQLINRTSESGFVNDTPSKKLLKNETLQDSFNHLFNQHKNQEGYRPTKKRVNSSSNEYTTPENYQFKNILTGNNVSEQRRHGLGMVDQSQYRREEISLANEFRHKVNQQRNNSLNSSYQKLHCSNIFFREDLPSRENSASKTLNDSINNGLSSATNKLKERKAALYNSNHVRGCLDHNTNYDSNGQQNFNSASKDRSIHKFPISNISNNVTALMISPEVLSKQTKESQDYIAQILSTQNTSKGKLILQDRNQSPMTKGLLKNETMGTPQRFLLSESSNKISSRHQHNQFSSPYVSSVRNRTSNSFFH